MPKIDGAKEIFEKINQVSARADRVIKNCSVHIGRMFSIFLGTLVACLLIIGGIIFWSYQTQNKLQEVKLEIEQANTHLQGKPLFLISNGKNYVRIVPGTESYPKDDKKYQGEYAEIWNGSTK